MRGCRSVEIDVWDGEPDSPVSSDAEGGSSSSSDSDDENGTSLGTKLKSKIRSKTDKSKTDSKGMSRSVSAKLGDALRRKSNNGPSDATAKATSPTQTLVKGEPRVLHGHTLTKGTTFREICYAIRDSAFVASDLPVVVSLEVHACLEQQQMMVDIIHEAWGNLLVTLPPNTEPEKLPILADLKRKILIKAKSAPLRDADAVGEEEVSPQPSKESPVQEQPQKPAKPSKVHEGLAKLAVYTRAYHFSRFDQPGIPSPRFRYVQS